MRRWACCEGVYVQGRVVLGAGRGWEVVSSWGEEEDEEVEMGREVGRDRWR